MEKLKSKQAADSLALLLAGTYMVSYITRTNFGAIVSEMSEATGFSKELLSMSLTGSFVTYGAGQTVSGWLGDRISPKKLVSWGLLLTVLMNLLIPLCGSPWQMLLVWCINGFAQAFLWPPMVRMMTALLSAEDYKNAAAKVSWGGSLGTIGVYLLSPVIITAWRWQGVFLICAALGGVMLLVWSRKAVDIPPETREKRRDGNTSLKLLLTPVMLCILGAIMLQGMLRDGVTTWMPTLIAESYDLDNAISILTGVLLPLCSMLSVEITNLIYQKRVTDPIACAALLFGAGAASALAMYFCCGTGVLASALLAAALTGCMHGVNLMLISILPRFFESCGSTALVSGVLNSCTYIGSAVSAWGIAALSEMIGWQDTIFLWFLIAAAGGLICLGCIRPWKRKFTEEER